MKQDNPGAFYIALWWLLIPFIAIWNIIAKPAKKLDRWFDLLYFFMVWYCIHLIIEIIIL